MNFKQGNVPEVILAPDDGRQGVALFIDLGVELVDHRPPAIGHDVQPFGLVFIGIEEARCIGAVLPDQRLEIAPGVGAEAFQVGEVIGRDDLRPLGDDPALADDGLIRRAGKLGIGRLRHQVVVDIGDAEGVQVLARVPQHLRAPGGILDPFAIYVHID